MGFYPLSRSARGSKTGPVKGFLFPIVQMNLTAGDDIQKKYNQP